MLDRPFDAVIFDMDGTLVESTIDFVALRHRLELPEDVGVLEGIDALPEPRRSHAHRALLETELAGARRAQLLEGAVDAVSAIRAAGLPAALLTRNASEAMATVLERYPQLEFDLAWSREQGPIKPEPDGILKACRHLQTTPGRTLCVGDFHYDIIAANAAGATAVLLCDVEPPAWANEAWRVIRSLRELPGLLGIE